MLDSTSFYETLHELQFRRAEKNILDELHLYAPCELQDWVDFFEAEHDMKSLYKANVIKDYLKKTKYYDLSELS
ncbi:MAG: hypothetical protein EKK56_00825 [Flavobacteriaceae bacterium]|nr:MAG: hypothetical protein EKK56_00825 [Flavobacteriaceae bacterium]